eukprot:TRINITY_DN47780_c0_g1_i1.p3 TRINITY_DN47780_c0_g1~~TRINITY_DN47780_c0_g1_i1.p3  ORF type:complete len:114 (+),score=35.57 TRINITY_DN47780_c0_g1_i1:101-442(+)
MFFCYREYYLCFFFNDTATTEIYTRSIVGSVRCVQETGINAEYMGPRIWPDSVTINVGIDNPVPICTVPGMAWKQVVHKNESTWLASYKDDICLLYTSPSPRDLSTSRMPSSA